jgi:hypothetical protein
MRTVLLITILSFAFTIKAQENPTVVFNFDSTKVYVKYSDIVFVLKKRNKSFKKVSAKATKRDTILLDGHTLRMGKYYDTLAIELHDELFLLIDQKIGTMVYKGNAVTAYETRKVRTAKDGKKYFVGIYYYDAASKKHFLTRTLYQRWNMTPFPDF